MEDKICTFKKYANQVVDLMVDSFKWKVLAENCDDYEMKTKYKSISDTLLDLFMVEHNKISDSFKNT